MRAARSYTFLLGRVAAALLLVSGAAGAQGSAPDDEGAYVPKTERRGDFTLGASAGLLVGNATGYPNEVGKIDNSAYVADPGPGVGYHYTVWLGGALRDWFTFALGLDGLSYQRRGMDVAGTGFVFRVEVFPLFDAFPQGRDLGLYGSVGLGGLTIKEGSETRADGGAMSLVGLGAFYEPLRFGSFSAGPTVEYQQLFSQTVNMQSATAGMRLAFYAAP